MNTRSLRFQLGLWYAALLTGTFLLLGSAMVLLLYHYLLANVRDSQLRRARQTAQSLSPDVTRKGTGAIAEEIETRFSPGANNRFVRVRRSDGAVVYLSGPPQDQTFAPESVPLSPWPKESQTARKVRLANGMELLIASRLHRTSDGTMWLVESGAPLDVVQAVLRQAVWVIAATLLCAVSLSVAAGYFLVGRALAVVDHLASSAERISVENLSERLPVARTGDEIEHLSSSLNRMIQRLDESFQRSKRFVADASHELRTPLTAMRGELEALVQQEGVGPKVQERLGSVLEEVDRLAKVVQGLLMLSRLDAGEAQGESVKVDLAQLTVSTADQMSLLAEDKKIAISCETPKPVFVQGDRTRLKQVIVNLLDNAIKYTPKGGTVTLRVRDQDGRAILEVIDSGIGIPAHVLPHVFDRFFRADEARSRDLGGAGLGLAIVRSICVAHGGRVHAQSVEGQGSRFTVELPLVGSASTEIQPGNPPGKDPLPPRQQFAAKPL